MASSCLKLLEHLVHACIASHVSAQLDERQSGFRWEAGALVGSLIDILNVRPSTWTCAAFVDIQKTFDTSWVAANLMQLFDAGVTDHLCEFIARVLRHTRSEVQLGTAL